MKTKWLSLSIIIVSLGLLLSACTSNENNEGTNSANPKINPNEGNQTGQEQQSESIILYYSDSDLMNIYKVKTEVTVEEGNTIEQAAIDAWLSGPEEAKLTNLLPAGTTVEFIKADDGIAHVSFSEEIRNAAVGSSGEAAIVDQITMLMEQFGHEKTQILVDGQIITELLGHMTYDEPFEARRQDDYEWYPSE